ncbi:response regulator [Trichloromonas sp.]|uniref:response regulator n=1 Tax=Trichloromonas sp. TaxID=3069249 RepID=UPI003D814AD5
MKTIMVVDDQPNIRQLVEIALKKDGRRILAVESGERAIEVALSESPDLIIMDVMMPGGMDGFQTIEILRSNPVTCACPVLVLTAKSQESEKRRSEEVGAEGYMAKPFRLTALVEHVERLLN